MSEVYVDNGLIFLDDVMFQAVGDTEIWCPSTGCYFKTTLTEDDAKEYQISYSNNLIIFKKNNFYHRENDQPAIVSPAFKTYFRWNKKHRIGGPASSHYCSNTNEYFVKNKRHRLDGPAVEIEDWYCWLLNDKKYAEYTRTYGDNWCLYLYNPKKGSILEYVGETKEKELSDVHSEIKAKFRQFV
jgi:hypothetical protein